MIGDLQAVFLAAYNIFNLPLTIYGFTFSLWQVMIWSIVAGLLIWFIVEVFSN